MYGKHLHIVTVLILYWHKYYGVYMHMYQHIIFLFYFFRPILDELDEEMAESECIDDDEPSDGEIIDDESYESD